MLQGGSEHQPVDQLVWSKHAVERAHKRYGEGFEFPIDYVALFTKANRRKVNEHFIYRVDGICFQCVRLIDKVLIVTVHKDDDRRELHSRRERLNPKLAKREAKQRKSDSIKRARRIKWFREEAG